MATKHKQHSYHQKLEEEGHRLILDDDGSVDIFRLDDGIHNGPECERCGEKWCHHCRPTASQCVPTKKDGKNPKPRYFQYAVVEFDNCGPTVTRFESDKPVTMEIIHQHLVDTDEFDEDSDSLTLIADPDVVKL